MILTLPAPATRAAWRAVTPRERQVIVGRMEEVLHSLGGPLVPPAQRLVRADSKMLRPGLVLAVAAQGDGPGRLHGDRAVSGAAAVELLHCATLVHDDLLDGAKARRGVATVSACEGPATAVLTGDFLIAAAQTAALEVGPGAVAATVSALAQLCIGQAGEDDHRYDMTTTAADVLAVARAKTGTLLHAACVIGAAAAGLPESLTEPLATYGSNFGTALQVVDDVLDLASTGELLGKPVGTDLRNGVMGLPTALALGRAPALTRLITPSASGEDLARAAELIVGCGALADAVELARSLAARATHSLDAFVTGGFAQWPVRYVETLLQTRVAPSMRARLGVRG